MVNITTKRIERPQMEEQIFPSLIIITAVSLISPNFAWISVSYHSIRKTELELQENIGLDVGHTVCNSNYIFLTLYPQ